MIRKAAVSDFGIVAADECAVRINCLRYAYGLNASFIQFYTDEKGGLLSVMDGVAVAYLPHPNEEWLVFLAMNSDIDRIHCSGVLGRLLTEQGVWRGRGGTVLSFVGQQQLKTDCICECPNLPEVYSLLCACFDDMPPLNAWYPDVSHRLRHNCAKIAAITDEKRVISTAMSVAEIDDFAILGQVATHPQFRGRGLAKRCINSLISRCKGKTLYILPKTQYAASLYESMGFARCGEWAELQRA